MNIIQWDNSILITKNGTQHNQIDALLKSNSALERQVLQLQRKQTNQSSYLGKRLEVESFGVFETQANHPQKSKNDIDLLSKRISSITIKNKLS